MKHRTILVFIIGLGLIGSTTIGLLTPRSTPPQHQIEWCAKENSVTGTISPRAYLYESEQINVRYLEFMRDYLMHYSKDLWKDWKKRKGCKSVQVEYLFELAFGYIIVTREVYFVMDKNEDTRTRYFKDVLITQLRPAQDNICPVLRYAPSPVLILPKDNKEITDEQMKEYTRQFYWIAMFHIFAPLIVAAVTVTFMLWK